jgi:hypothetical protein
MASGSDEVIVLPGDYPESDEVTVGAAVTVHGAAGALPRVVSTATDALSVEDPGARVSDLAVEHTGAGSALSMVGGTAERVFAHSAGGIGCGLSGGNVLLRDSVCWATSGATAASFDNAVGAATATLRNVTAVSAGGGGSGLSVTAGVLAQATINGRNVIADGAGSDVAADGAGGIASADLANSNYSTEEEGAATASVTDAGTGTNQATGPLFADPAAGDFHQLAESPTIDAGALDGQLGAVDIDGEPRAQGAAPDIGADELAPLPSDLRPPDTGIRKGPKKRTPKRHAKFKFGGSEPGVTFECNLDGRGFKPCTSPQKYRSLRRTKHVFAVRAIDRAGNADPTPADRKWRITKKRKRR